ncbi:MAG: helix-turn-helix transcriptional regulator [Clostridiales bacterium]|nr:helix-turn-helix transcriptional regulator [Clostridiales bacterium]
MEELELKRIIAKNLVAYRKQAHMTQAELAEKINYSDKAVSKWERAEGVPDVLVLHELAELYGVTVNDFLTEHAELAPPKLKTKSFWAKRWLITLLSAGLVFLIATIITVLWLLIDPHTSLPIVKFTYLAALPVALIVVLVFSCIWGKLWQRCLVVTALVWTLCVLTQLILGLTMSNAWLIYLVGAVLQILVVMWYLLAFFRHRGRAKSNGTDEK